MAHCDTISLASLFRFSWSVFTSRTTQRYTSWGSWVWKLTQFPQFPATVSARFGILHISCKESVSHRKLVEAVSSAKVSTCETHPFAKPVGWGWIYIDASAGNEYRMTRWSFFYFSARASKGGGWWRDAKRETFPRHTRHKFITIISAPKPLSTS